MSILEIAIYIFLAIFILTAVITILSLVNMVKIEPYYKKQLFRVLILQVIGVIVTFVSNGIISNSTTNISEELLINNVNGWDWSYPESAWKTKIHFKRENDSLYLKGTTYFYKDGKNRKPLQIIEWKSNEAITIPAVSKDISFNAAMRWKEDALQLNENLGNEINKWREGKIKLKMDISLSGSFISNTSDYPWNIVMTPFVK